ncbi:MAG: 2-phosphosulfolactate phosphatase [Chloroflexota bacterium]
MIFEHASLDDCAEATGLVVVIDVIRAFTSAAVALAAGATEILLVSTVEEALALRQRFPASLLMGEVGGLRPAGFDFGNSPFHLVAQDLSGKRMIQRTSAGTQGVVRSLRAEPLLASSFVCARATVCHIQRLQPGQVTLVVTGIPPLGMPGSLVPGMGAEDAACADYLKALLLGQSPDPRPYRQRVWDSPAAHKFIDPTMSEFPLEDLDYCMHLDRYDFSMPIYRRGDLLVMEKFEDMAP